MINRREFIQTAGAGAAAVTLGGGALHALAETVLDKPVTLRPNIVLIVTDDLGYGDLSCYGHPKIKTPNLDKLANLGTRFTDFCVAAAVCSPSRAAMLTGCYPKRVDITYALYSRDRRGLAPSEETLPEILKKVGYDTCMVGKWHLGLQPEFLPPSQGFDKFFGVPYSNDMHPHFHKSSYTHPAYPLYDGRELVDTNPDQEILTKTFGERAAAYIKRQAKTNERRIKREGEARPFFLYVPFTAPHEPLHVSDEFKGKSEAGLYGDVVEELDAGVGVILDRIAEMGIEEETLIIFTSDNGHAIHVPGTEDSSGGLRGGKGSTYEGGFRVPCIATWKGHIEAGRVSDAFWSGMDFVPTLAALTGAPLPDQTIIDGKSALPLLLGETNKTAYDQFMYYNRRKVEGIRQGEWKYRDGLGNERHPETGERIRIAHGPQLFNLSKDHAESMNLVEKHPEIAEMLREKMEMLDKELSGQIRPSVKAPRPEKK